MALWQREDTAYDGGTNMSIDLEDLEASLEQLVELHGPDTVLAAFARLCTSKANEYRAKTMNPQIAQRWMEVAKQIEQINMSHLG